MADGRPGRPSKLTPASQQAICELLEKGMTLTGATACVGLDRTTIQRWMARGRAAKRGKYAAFLRAIKAAEARSERTLLERIRKAGKETKHWTADAWILERRFPDRWGKRDRININAKVERVQIELIEPEVEPEDG